MHHFGPHFELQLRGDQVSVSNYTVIDSDHNPTVIQGNFYSAHLPYQMDSCCHSVAESAQQAESNILTVSRID